MDSTLPYYFVLSHIQSTPASVTVTLFSFAFLQKDLVVVTSILVGPPPKGRGERNGLFCLFDSLLLCFVLSPTSWRPLLVVCRSLSLHRKGTTVEDRLRLLKFVWEKTFSVSV